jgi:hypothetical protein
MFKSSDSINFAFAATSALLISLAASPSFASSKSDTGSPLPVEQEAKVKKANRLAKSGKHSKASQKFQSALDSATDVAQCLAVAEGTEKFGYPLMDVRRACLQKALTFGKTREDFMQIALKARQYQYYEITKSAIDFLIANANSNDELFELAQKSQELVLGDIARMSMEKYYAQTKTVPDAFVFAKRAKILNMEDMARKTIKDLIDDEPTPEGLCNLQTDIEPFQFTDLDRYLLKKAVYSVKTVTDCKAVFETAKRLGQPDIVNLAAYRGRKMIQKQQNEEANAQAAANAEAASAQAAVQAQEQRAANDMAKRNANYNNGPGF